MGISASAAAAISAATAVAGSGIGAYGAIKQGQAQRSAAVYQAQVAKNNATVAGYNANLAQQQAANQAQAAYRQGALKMGAQRAALGANGGTLDSGSAADVQRSTAESTQIAANNDIYQGQLQAYGYGTQAQNYTGQAGMDVAAGNNATTAGALSATGSILGGASQFASKWNNYYRLTSDTTSDPNSFEGQGA